MKKVPVTPNLSEIYLMRLYMCLYCISIIAAVIELYICLLLGILVLFLYISKLNIVSFRLLLGHKKTSDGILYSTIL